MNWFLKFELTLNSSGGQQSKNISIVLMRQLDKIPDALYFDDSKNNCNRWCVLIRIDVFAPEWFAEYQWT